jgi:uncharacterized membrane protein
VSPADNLPDGSGAGRIVVLDVLRAFAILMMLQGHFVDTMLDPLYRDLANPVYAGWNFMRGVTAPVFFFVSGMVFVFLLLRESRPWRQSERIRKGLRRAALLLLLGYILKWNFIWLIWSRRFYPSNFTVDVFQILGLSLLVAIALVVLCRSLRLPLPLAFAALAMTAFLAAPDIRAHDWSALPVFLQNYLVRTHGSTFTLFPWIGYALSGGVAGWALHTRPGLSNSRWTPVLLLLAGLAMHFQLDDAVGAFQAWTGSGPLALLSGLTGPLWRLGHVFIVLAVFIWIVRSAGTIPPLVTRIGRETLTIYSVHYVVLYGTWFGVGIATLGRGTWPPWAVVIGAAIFLAGFVYLIHRIDEIRATLRRTWRQLWRRPNQTAA